MRHEPDNVVASLGLHLAAQRLLLGVGAGEEEVLPDHEAQLVARVVEGVVLVDAAAPDPHQVHARVGGLAQPGGKRSGVIRDGNTLSAIQLTPREDPFAVDDEGEAGAVPVRLSGPVPRSGSRCAGARSPGAAPRNRGRPRRVRVPGRRAGCRSRGATTGRRPAPPASVRRASPPPRRAPRRGRPRRWPARRASGPSPGAVRSTSTRTSTRPVPRWTVTSGRTSASRAVDHRSSRTGRQMPAVTRVGPQSQPKLHAILRMYWNGSG
ncbi:hypothetical protein SVIOM342S_06001 [Streptomyces violaceorubidus]